MMIASADTDTADYKNEMILILYLYCVVTNNIF